jgi:hypothetical protein
MSETGLTGNQIREIIREEIEKYEQERAKYLSLSIDHDFSEQKIDTIIQRV